MSAYLMRLICAAILCALVDALAGSGTGGGMRRVTAGIFLTLVAFSLPTELKLPELEPERFFREAQAAAAEGEDLAREECMERILQGCEAYVLNKAKDMGLEVSVTVTLDELLRPSHVELDGAASPLQRQEMTDVLVRELGVMEEDVVWKESYQSRE